MSHDPLDSCGGHTADLPPLIDCDWRGDANRYLLASAHADPRIATAPAVFASAADCCGDCGPCGDAAPVTDADDASAGGPQ